MRAASLLPIFLAAAALVGVGACKEDDHYVYTARKFNADNACLEDDSSIELVPGNDVNPRCSPLCLTVGEDLFVSSLCGGIPSKAKLVDGADPVCKAALDAYFKQVACSAVDASTTPSTDAASD